MQKRLLHLIACLIFCTTDINAQVTTDSTWFDDYYTRSITKKELNDPHAFDSLEIVFAIALKKNFVPAISRYHIEKAGLFIAANNKDAALYHLKEAVRIAEESGRSEVKANAFLNLANFYQYNSNTLSAAQYYLKAVTLLKQQGRRRTLIGLYWNLYIIFNRLQQKNAALESILSAVIADRKSEKDLVSLINESNSEEVGFNFPDQTLVKEIGTNGIWVIFGGAKFPITTADELGSYGSVRDVQRIPPGSLANIPFFPRNGSVLREMDDGMVYVTKDDTLYRMGSFEALETYGGWDGVYFVPPNSLRNFPKSDSLQVTVDNRNNFFNYGQAFEILTDSITSALKKNETLSNQLSRQLAARNNALQKRRMMLWISGTGLIALLIIVILLIRNFRQKQKVLKAEEELRGKMALEKERTRIATDMHDDLGAGLSRIKFLSETIGMKKQQHLPVEEEISSIREHSHEMIGKMGEIVWALNEKNDSLNDLIAYTRSYVVEYLSQNGIGCEVHIPENIRDRNVSGEFRRNIYLSVKEALHNIVKHAQAKHVKISIETGTDILINISDDGIGYKESNKPNSNGLLNMQKRMKDINGKFEIKNSNGTTVRLSAPVSS